MISNLPYFMEECGVEKLEELVRIANSNIITVEDIEHDFIVYPKFDRNKCIKCGRCYISCYDGVHQALSFEKDCSVSLKKMRGLSFVQFGMSCQRYLYGRDSFS